MAHKLAHPLAPLLLASSLAAIPTAPVLASDLYDSNTHLWLGVVGDHPVAGSPWGVHLEAQVRRAEFGESWQQLLIRPGINYTLNDRIAFSGGYCFVETFSYGDFPVPDSFPEHRVWEQISLVTPFLGLDWSHRFRLEQRWIGELAAQPGGVFDTENFRYENRFRYQIRTSVPLGASGKTYLVAWDEVFLNFGSEVEGNTFDQNRAFVGVGQKLGRHFRLEAGFLEQTLQRRFGRIWENNHTVAIYLFSNAPFGGSAGDR